MFCILPISIATYCLNERARIDLQVFPSGDFLNKSSISQFVFPFLLYSNAKKRSHKELKFLGATLKTKYAITVHTFSYKLGLFLLSMNSNFLTLFQAISSIVMCKLRAHSKQICL